MINVEKIYQNVRDISRKDHAGYTSSDEFNRMILIAQNDLYDYYLSVYERTGRIAAALTPFRVSASLPYPGNTRYPSPADYRQWLEVGVEWVSSTCEDVTKTPYPAEPLKGNEKLLTLSSAVRRPSLVKKRFKYQIIDDIIHLYPETFVGQLLLEYLRVPVNPVRGYTVDIFTQFEIYNPATSVNFEWPISEEGNITDLMLFYKGMQVQTSAIIDWVQRKKSLAVAPESITLSQNA